MLQRKIGYWAEHFCVCRRYYVMGVIREWGWDKTTFEWRQLTPSRDGLN